MSKVTRTVNIVAPCDVGYELCPQVGHATTTPFQLDEAVFSLKPSRYSSTSQPTRQTKALEFADEGTLGQSDKI
jgi:hypothetical protein